MSYRKTATVLIGVLLLMTPVLAQKKEAPSSRLVPYRGSNLEMRFPENWVVTKTGQTVTLSPEDGIVEGALAYGLLTDIFEPRSGNPAEGRSQMTLSETTNLLIEELRRTNPNLRTIRSAQQEIGGLPALEVEMTNKSPVGGVEVDRLIAVQRNEKLHYFLAVAPQVDLDRYNPIFNKMIASIRFYN